MLPDFAIVERFPDARACRPIADLVQGTRAQLELGDRPRRRLELVGGHGDPPLIVDPVVDPQAVEARLTLIRSSEENRRPEAR